MSNFLWGSGGGGFKNSREYNVSIPGGLARVTVGDPCQNFDPPVTGEFVGWQEDVDSSLLAKLADKEGIDISAFDFLSLAEMLEISRKYSCENGVSLRDALIFFTASGEMADSAIAHLSK